MFLTLCFQACLWTLGPLDKLFILSQVPFYKYVSQKHIIFVMLTKESHLDLAGSVLSGNHLVPNCYETLTSGSEAGT